MMISLREFLRSEDGQKVKSGIPFGKHWSCVLQTEEERDRLIVISAQVKRHMLSK